MNYFKTHKIIALFLAVLMILPLIPAVDLTVFAEGSDNLETISNELAANVGKQAIFDKWDAFLFVDTPLRTDIIDIYNTDPETAYLDQNNYWYYYDQFGKNPDSAYINAWEAILQINDYRYDSTNGYHWYNVSAINASPELAEVLQTKSWVLYTTDIDIEAAVDPNLAVYNADETIRFVVSETQVVEYERDEFDEIKIDENGDPIVSEIRIDLNYFVLAGPSALQNATIGITYQDTGYPVSALAYTENTHYTTFSKAFIITITKSDSTPWTAADGEVSVRYEATQFGTKTYNANYGAAYLYVNDIVYSYDINDLYNWDSTVVNEVVYTNSGTSTLVFEHMPEDFAIINKTGYPTAADITVYNNTLASSQTISAPSSFEVLYSFTQVIYEDKTEVVDGVETTTKVISAEIPWYWLDLGSEYCFVKQDSVTFESNELINTKVIIKPSVTSVDVYFDPRTDVSEYLTLDAALFDGVYKVTDTYYSATENILFYGLAPCEYIIWPEKTNGYRYVSSEIVEETDQGIAFPIVDFCHPAPLMKHNPQIQPRSAIYGARSAIARASLYSTDSLLSTAAEGTDPNASVKLNKVVKDNRDGSYEVKLEAYATATVTLTAGFKPMDIVLVIDQSGSMSQCIVCGQSMSSSSTHAKYKYTETYSTNSGERYILSGGSYTRVYYCDGSNYYNCDAGWYTSQHGYGSHGGNRVYPKTSATDTTAGRVQFYIRSQDGTEPCSRRYDALITALNTFVKEVKAKSVDSEGNLINHRIAIVGFSSNGYNNTELLTGVSISDNSNTNLNNNGTKYYPYNEQRNGVQYGNITEEQYKTALQDVSTEAGYANVNTAIDALTAHGGTQTLDGLTMAYNILDKNIMKSEDRESIVILFTDGATNSDRENLLNQAYNIKHNFDTTVYSIGIFDGANGNPASFTESVNNDNSLMHMISSNYPDAHYSYWGGLDVGDPNPAIIDGSLSYYLSASNATALNGIFQALSSQVGGTPMPLDSNTVVKDIITPQFTLPSNNTTTTTNIIVQKQYCTAYNPDEPFGPSTTWGTIVPLDSAAISIDAQTHSVNVSGFDFAANYVSELGRNEKDDTQAGDFKGAKLVITFTITPDPDFLGGDNVVTNGVNSGIYSSTGECFGKFIPGLVNVPLKNISTIVKNKHIYYGNTTDLTGILDLWAVSRDDQNKALPVDVDGINNAYVYLLYTVKLNDSTVAQYYVPAGEPWGSENCTWRSTAQTQLLQNYQALVDTEFSVECSMVSAASTGNVKKAIDTATVYVYKPTLEFKDSEQKYKAALNPNDGFLGSHFVGATWSHPTQNSTIEGTAPSFEFTFDHSGAFDNGIMNSVRDVPVNVTVTINGTGTAITNNQGVTFKHSTCNHPECAFNPATEEFIVHVVGALTSLKIQKVTKNQNGTSVSFENIDPNQTFLFRVMGKDADGNDINVTVTVHAKDGSTIVDGLVIGNQYTVQELTDWSWRYTCELGAYTNGDGVQTDNTFVQGTATLTITSLGEEDNVATFENTRNTEYWLDGDSWCDNRFMANVTQAIN